MRVLARLVLGVACTSACAVVLAASSAAEPSVHLAAPGFAPDVTTFGPAAAITGFEVAGTGDVRSLERRAPAAERAAGGVSPAGPALGAERARILLRSLTLPGWGQATLGRRTSATAFGLAELGVWASFTAFRIQEHLRTDTYERTARLFAGIDLDDRDEEFRRIVGSFLSNEEYNQLVVAREAANLYLRGDEDDDPVAYRAYIEAHELKGDDAWRWSVPDLLRYREQRKQAQRAELRANTALALAIANRLISAVHAARVAGRPATSPRSWNLEIVPVDGNDATAFQFGVRTRF